METSDFLWDQEHTHPPEEILERYAMGRTSDEESERVEDHVIFCRSCQQALDHSAQWVDLMKAAAGPPMTVAAASPSAPAPYSVRKGFSLRDFFQLWTRIPAPAYAGAFAAIAMVYLAAPPQTKTATSQSVSLSAMRGNDLRVEVEAGVPSQLTFDEGEDLNGSRASVVTVEGAEVWSGAVVQQQVRTPALQAGPYWVRLYTSKGEQVKEYGIVAR
ncbi:hypothetical protein F183_A15510 [Bryobacterales bacterium F-183]|nr:hypothetical protein F183_A15510 [Bryobacterales bacterium F-183]